MELVLPSSKYIQSYNAYIEEFGDEVRYPFPMDFDHQDFDALLAKLSDFANGGELHSELTLDGKVVQRYRVMGS